MNEQVSIECGPADRDGKRLVIASLGSKAHRDRLDCDNNFSRSKFIEKAIAKFKLPASAHEWLNDEIVRLADEQDESPAASWVPQATHLADVKPATPHWLWDGKFPLGAITIVDGDGGIGKSQMMIDLACRGGRGEPLPEDCYAGKPWGTLIVTSEDANDFVIRPRIDAAGGDNGGIYSMSSVAIDGTNKRQVELPLDLPALERFIAANNIKLVVIDPFSQFLQSGLDPNSDSDCRKCLGPMAEMAERLAIAIVLIRHLTKKVGTSARHRGGGSVAILAAARAGYLLGIDPDDPNCRVLAPTKNNLAPEPASLSFTIEQVGTTSRVRWQGESSVTANAMVKAETSGGAGNTKLDAAKRILRDTLAGGPRGESEVLDAMEDAEISRRTYWRARKDLGVVSEKTGFGKAGEWLLSLNGACHDEF